MKICVYGASSNSIDKSFIEAGEAFGREMVKRGHELIFGGGDTGLMGAVARGVYSTGGRIIGVSPKYFDVDGVLFTKCTEMILTDNIRERKQILDDRADAFVVTPGGVGTYDEFFEILTLRQLGRYEKPLAIFDVNGYFEPLLKLLDNTAKYNFMKDATNSLDGYFTDISETLDYIENYDLKGEFSITDYKSVTER